MKPRKLEYFYTVILTSMFLLFIVWDRATDMWPMRIMFSLLSLFAWAHIFNIVEYHWKRIVALDPNQMEIK